MSIPSARTPAKTTGRAAAGASPAAATPLSAQKRQSVTGSTFGGGATSSRSAAFSRTPTGTVTSPMNTHRDPNNSTVASFDTTTKSMATTMSGTKSGGGGENVKVYIRLRDFSNNEKEKFIPSDLAVRMSGSTVEVNVPGRGKFPFTFDEVFWSNSMEEEGKPYADQADLYEVVGAPLVSNVLSGFNSSIIAYGQTGSGKTYSIFGPSVDEEGTKKGLIPRVCDGIFAALQAESQSTLNKNTKFTVSVTMLEVYLEEVFDLLNKRTKLAVRQDTATSFGVVGAKTFDVKSYEEVLKLIEKGDSQKTFAATAMNERSSRAHTLFQLVVSAVSSAGSRSAKVMLADLAGCERIKVSKTDHGTALDEACNINLSLLTLGTCIEAAVARSKQGRGIEGMGEFRQSTLTKLLKDFIGGNSRTAMLIAIAPALKDVNLTLQALRFADRAKQIHTHAKINYVHGKSTGGAMGGRIAEDLKSLYDSKKELLDKEYQLEKIQAELAQRQDDVALAQLRLDEERRAIAERFKLSETSEEEKKMLQARVLEIESTMKSLSQELTDMEKEKDLMRERILAVAQENAAIVSDKEELERQIITLQNRILELETERDEEMLLLQDQKASLEKDIEVLEERLKAREAYHARIAREEKAAAEKAMAELRAQLGLDKQKALDEEKAKYAMLETSHAASRKQCFSLTASLENEKKAFEQFKAEAAAEKQKTEETHARSIEVLQSHFSTEMDALSEKLKALEAALAAEKATREGVEADLSTKTKGFNSLKSSTDAKISQLEETLAKAVASHATHAEELTSTLKATEIERVAAMKALSHAKQVSSNLLLWAGDDLLLSVVKSKEDALFAGISAVQVSDASAKKAHLDAVNESHAAEKRSFEGQIASLSADIAAKISVINEYEATITDLNRSVSDLDKFVAEWKERAQNLQDELEEARRAASEAAEITEAEHQLADELEEQKRQAIAALNEELARAATSYAALQKVLEEEKISAEMKAVEEASAHAKALADQTQVHAEKLAVVIAEHEGRIAAAQKAYSDLSSTLANEQLASAGKTKNIESLNELVAKKEAESVALKAQHKADMSELRESFEKDIADMQHQHRKDLATLKTTATTVAQQQHHHAKILASEAHQAQFMIQQALTKFHNAMASSGGVSSLETVFAGIGSRTNSGASLTSPTRANTAANGGSSSLESGGNGVRKLNEALEGVVRVESRSDSPVR